jgi:hypothetical protein
VGLRNGGLCRHCILAIHAAQPFTNSLHLNVNIKLTCHYLDPFLDADEDTGETKQAQNYIHIRIQRTSNRTILGTCPDDIPNILLFKTNETLAAHILTF